MSLFLSSALSRLDAKGRVSVPASWRAALERETLPGLVCCLSPDRPALDCGGRALLDEIRQWIDRTPPFSAEREQVSAVLYGTSETLRLDGEGRLTLSETLKRHCGITDSIAFVGLGHKFQIWEPSRFNAQLAQGAALLRTLRGEAGAAE